MERGGRRHWSIIGEQGTDSAYTSPNIEVNLRNGQSTNLCHVVHIFSDQWDTGPVVVHISRPLWYNFVILKKSTLNIFKGFRGVGVGCLTRSPAPG